MWIILQVTMDVLSYHRQVIVLNCGIVMIIVLPYVINGSYDYMRKYSHGEDYVLGA